MKKIFLTLLGLTCAWVSAQQKTHKVVAGENFSTIAKKYGVSVDELIKQNPKIKNGKIDIGDILNLPSKAKNIAKKTEEKKEEKKGEKKSAPQKSAQKLGKVEIQPKQTVYGITKQYKISEAELRKLNPNLDNLMKPGESILLPEELIKKYGGASQSSSETVATSSKKQQADSSTEGDTYTIQPKDTFYGITKKFGISQKELLALNPQLEQKGLQPRETIRVKGGNKEILTPNNTENPIPTIDKNISQKERETKTKIHSVEDYLIHEVQKGDTAFGIVNKYNITYDQLAQLNGGLKDGIKQGMQLRIKRYERQFVKTDDDVISIALILPFGFDSNDSKYRTLAADFLIGAKIAAQRNVRNGKKVNINVIDAENETSFRNNLSQINKTNTDLIIGPFFKTNVLEVWDYVKNDKIPVVAPFAHTEDLYDYNNLILVETGNRVYSERIVREVKNAHSKEKIFLIGEENNSEVQFLKEQLSKELSKAEIVITTAVPHIELDQNMVSGQKLPALFILASDDNSIGASFTKKVIELSKQVEGVKAFSMYHHPDFDKNETALGQVNLVYLMDRKVDSNGDFEKEVLAEFKKEYCRVPSKYTIIGFDVVNDMLAREVKGDVLRNMSKVQTQLATKFEYVRMKRNGAFVNTGFRVIRLLP